MRHTAETVNKPATWRTHTMLKGRTVGKFLTEVQYLQTLQQDIPESICFGCIFTDTVIGLQIATDSPAATAINEDLQDAQSSQQAALSWPSRSALCASIGEGDVGNTVTICGWVDRYRNMGGIVFADIRDHTGVLQVCSQKGKIYDGHACSWGCYQNLQDGHLLR